MDIKKDIRFRVYLTFTAILMLAVAIVIKTAYIQLSQGEELRLKAQKAHTRKEKLDADRGNIYADNGQLISSTIPQFDLRIDFGVINKDTFRRYVDTIATSLSHILQDKTTGEYKHALTTAFRNKEHYWLLKNNVLYGQYQQVRSLPVFSKGKNRGGFIAEAKSKRVNPYGWLAFRTVGLWRETTRKDSNTGKVKTVDINIGLEKSYDSVLAGNPGSRIERKTTGGVWMPMQGSEIEPVNGKDIVTTIDIDIQDITENALLKSLERNKCKYGTAIVMETKTGKIKAMANLGLQADGTYAEDYNYALLATEPGSTFKLMTLYAVLEDGYATINDDVNAYGGRRTFGNQTIVDDHSGLGNIPIKKAFALSSNVSFATLADKYYKDNPMKYIHHLQFLKLNKPSGIDLTGESRTLIKTTASKSWNKVTSLPWIGYGYESLVTPLHTLMVYNAVANNGTMMKPYLVSEIKEYGQVVDSIQPTVLIKKIGKASTIQQLKLALKAVVDEGTARGIKSPYYDAGGKTGTAQIADKGITYADGVRQGSFIGFFPYDNPQYSIAVLVRSTPHGAYYGATVAAPVFKEIADKLYATHIGGWKMSLPDNADPAKHVVAKRGIGTNLYEVLSSLGLIAGSSSNGVNIAGIQINDKDQLMLAQTNIDDNAVPDVTGMGLKDALYLLENTGLRVNISGMGKVVSQSIAAGNKIQKGQQIILQLG